MKKLLLIVFFSPLWLSHTQAQAKKCLLQYQTKLDQLLPLAVIQQHYKGDMSKAQKNYNFSPEAKKHDTDSYEYTWPSNRKRKMTFMGNEIEVEENNRIGLSWVGSDLFLMMRKPTPLESFRAFYRNTTAAEKDAAFKKAEQQLKAKGYDEKTTKAASGMGKELAADNVMFRDISGVGQAASWRIKEKELTVLVEGTTFKITANVSTNDEENIALAKKLANEVLAKCK